MIRHIFLLVWNRKRSVALTVVEVFLSFFALFAVASFGLHFLELYRQPLGFSYDNVLVVSVERELSGLWTEEEQSKSGELLRETLAFDEVESAAFACAAPYTGAGIYTIYEAGGFQSRTQFWEVTDDFAEVLGLHLVAGRWFEPADEALHYRVVVINEQLANERFGGDAVGKTIEAGRGGAEVRVVGVISGFRHRGEFSVGEKFAFTRSRPGSPFMPMTSLLVKVRPGTGIDFEETLSKRLGEVAKGCSFEIRSLADMREVYLESMLRPLLVGSIVAAFLLIMVGLGLVGVLWQNVLQRIREIGLRRAKGASRQRIRRQLLGEVMVFTTLGIAVALAVVLQLGIFDVLGEISTGASARAAVVAAAMIYLLTAVCALYPCWLATRIEPAEALHHE